jgi:ABC-type oligopeptide transport system ATPase subunit
MVEIFEKPVHPYTKALIGAHLEENPKTRHVDRTDLPEPYRFTGRMLSSDALSTSERSLPSATSSSKTNI